MLNIYTIQIAKWRDLKGLEIVFVDTTVKSGSPLARRLLAPNDMKMVMDVKSGKITQEEYTERYLKKLKDNAVHLKAWLGRFEYSDRSVAFGCYCREGEFCHRHLLANFMLEISKDTKTEVSLLGEFKKEIKNDDNNETNEQLNQEDDSQG